MALLIYGLNNQPQCGLLGIAFLVYGLLTNLSVAFGGWSFLSKDYVIGFNVAF